MPISRRKLACLALGMTAAGSGLALLWFALTLAGLACFASTVRCSGTSTIARRLVTLGEVIAVHGKKGVFPTVRFAAPDGKIIILNESGAMSPPPRIGDQVEVIFHPDRPDDAYVVKTQWTGVFLIVFFAGMISFVGAAFRYRKQNPRPRRHGADASR